MQGKFVFLGTGSSAGIPVIGCECNVCKSTSSFNKRLRSAGLIQVGDKNLIIDLGPDLRTQALKYDIKHLDGALLTHAHADHIAGIDDLRAYYFVDKKKIPCILSQETFDEIKLRYHYLLLPPGPEKSFSAQVDFNLFPSDFGDYELAGIRFEYFSYFQMGMKVMGFRFGNFAYVSDIRDYSQRVVDMLQGVDILVLSALKAAPTKMHFSLEEAIAFSKLTHAKMTYLTHIGHELDHDAINAQLPSNVRLSYDGLELPIEISKKA